MLPSLVDPLDARALRGGLKSVSLRVQASKYTLTPINITFGRVLSREHAVLGTIGSFTLISNC